MAAWQPPRLFNGPVLVLRAWFFVCPVEPSFRLLQNVQTKESYECASKAVSAHYLNRFLISDYGDAGNDLYACGYTQERGW